MTEMIPLDTIRAAQERLEKLVHKTPLESNHTFSQISGREVYLKLENLQRTGSFKVRGASNCIMTLSEEQKARGIIAASAGNHAQGVALGSRMAHCKSTVVHAGRGSSGQSGSHQGLWGGSGALREDF